MRRLIWVLIIPAVISSVQVTWWHHGAVSTDWYRCMCIGYGED